VLAGRAADSQKLEDFIRVHHPRFLVYSDKGMLRPYLDLPQQCTQDEQVRDMRLDCFYSNAIYRVYGIQYSGGPRVSADVYSRVSDQLCRHADHWGQPPSRRNRPAD